jgi:DNA polymerase-1
VSETKKLFLIDVMPLLYRGHFVFLKKPRVTSTGLNTSALTGFSNSLVQILGEHSPTHLALVFDSTTPTFRHKAYPEYKAQRQKMPEDIAAAIPMAIELGEALRIPMLRVDGFEADDIMGTIAARAASEPGWTTYLVTPDKDVAQLVGPQTLLFRPGKAGSPAEIYDEAGVCAHWSLTSPGQMIEFLGLAGDTSDNIPGIPGVGEKTANTLLAQYGNIDNVLAHASELKGKLAEKVMANTDKALQSRELATIRKDVPLDIGINDLERREPDKDALRAVLKKYELATLGRRLLGDSFEGVETEDEKPLKTLADVQHNYVCVKTPGQMHSLLTALRDADEWAFDTETSGLDPRLDRIVGISFATAPGKAWYVPLPEDRVECQDFLAPFKPLFADPLKVKIAHNAKFDLAVLRQYGIEVCGELHDSMLAHYVIDASDRHGMDHLARQYLCYDPIPITALIGTKKRGVEQRNMADLTPDEICDYAAEDADVTLQLDRVLRKKAQADGCIRALKDCEEPLIRVLLDMESEGVRVDADALRQYGRELERELLDLEIQIRDLGGGNFNPSSPKQLGEILFDHLKLDPNAARTASGQYATGEEVLVKIQDRHPIIPLILEYRICGKLKSTYVDKLPDCIDPATGRVHTSFSQALTETGRLSSSDPNLQNIPIRTERGQRIRAAFVSRDNEHILLSADYSQIELRVMAALSGDSAMLDAFNRGADIHTETATRVYGVMPALVTPEMRATCKMVNFGIIYGISAFGLSQRLRVPRKQAADLIETYFAQYPGVKTYMEKAIADARETGYAKTILGRRRFLRDINSRNSTSRQSAERNAINTPVQGTAADLIKLAMVCVHRELGQRHLKTRMVLQIHDELLFDVPKEEADEVSALVKTAMETILDIGVPLEVSIGTGHSWLAAH